MAAMRMVPGERPPGPATRGVPGERPPGPAQSIRIAVIGGDGIGPEVVAEAIKVLQAAATGVAIQTTGYDLGAQRWLRTGEILPASALAEIAGHDAILLGAVGDPEVPSGVLERGLLLRLRFEFDQYVNLRPVRLYPGVASPLSGQRSQLVDMLVVREGTEGPYIEAGGVMRRGTLEEVATQESINTAFGVRRVAHYALQRAAARPRRKLTLVHKSNVLTYAGDLWRRTVDELEGVQQRDRRLLPHGRGLDLFRHPAGAVRRDRHRQHVRRHPDRARRCGGRRHRARCECQHQPGADRAEHVRARARQRAGHRRPAEGGPDGRDPVGGNALRAHRAQRRGGADRAGRGRGPG